MATQQHLIAALGKVQDAYAPYAPHPNDDDSDLNGDPGNDRILMMILAVMILLMMKLTRRMQKTRIKSATLEGESHLAP